ncbi:MAG: DUF885 family protein, partial [Alphaproteobacteria bacterium]
MRWRRFHFLAVLALLLAGCDGAGGDAAARLNALIDGLTRTVFTASPDLATYYAVDEALAGEGYNARLPDYGPEAEEKRRLAYARYATGLQAIPRERLRPEAQADLDIVRAIMASALGARDLAYGTIDLLSFTAHTPYIVSQISGPHIAIPHLMAAQQPVASPAQAHDYIARLQGFGTMFQGINAKIVADARAGL